MFAVDVETGRRVSRLARRLHVSEEDVLRRAVERYEQSPTTSSREDIAREWLVSFDKRFPLAEARPNGADKAFFDDLSGHL